MLRSLFCCCCLNGFCCAKIFCCLFQNNISPGFSKMHNEVRVLQVLFSHKLQHESGTSHDPKLWSGIVQPKVLGVGRRPQRTPYHFLTQVAFFASEVCLQLSHSRKDIVHASHNFFLFFLFPSQFLVGQINTRLPERVLRDVSVLLQVPVVLTMEFVLLLALVWPLHGPRISCCPK